MQQPVLESPAIHWHRDHLALLDQRLLPHRREWLRLESAEQVASAIRDMVVRGAPAIGISAAYGIALAARQLGAQANANSLSDAFETLATSRPTAVNLFWALDKLRHIAGNLTGEALVDALSQAAEQIHADDRDMNYRLGSHGVALLEKGKAVYTHCNTGALATGGHGTALGIIRSGWQHGLIPRVYAGETRPWMQGARLTSWELMEDNIDVTLVVDSCAAHLMASGEIGAVIVGADRITANGDTANKIGTYGLAVLAHHHGIPFIVAAPLSTIDADLANGSMIEIEQRPADEVRQVGQQQLAPSQVDVFNPAFDVTPANLISAIVTEHGVIKKPNAVRMAAHFREAKA